jgi:hypothetical protein
MSGLHLNVPASWIIGKSFSESGLLESGPGEHITGPQRLFILSRVLRPLLPAQSLRRFEITAQGTIKVSKLNSTDANALVKSLRYNSVVCHPAV